MIAVNGKKLTETENGNGADEFYPQMDADVGEKRKAEKRKMGRGNSKFQRASLNLKSAVGLTTKQPSNEREGGCRW